MNCTSCNQPIAPDAHFCTHCGTRIINAAAAQQPAAPFAFYNRVTRNLNALAALWFVYAGLRFLTGTAGLLFAHTFLRHSDINFGPFGHGVDFLLPAGILSLLISTGCAALTGYGLQTRQPWGRILAIVFAIFALIHIPFGTALGVYTLWVLGSRLSGDEYNALCANA